MAAATQHLKPPPRVLVLLEDQWPRALLRAALIEAGYDAVGARSVGEALEQPATDPERGPVRLVVVDRGVLAGAAGTGTRPGHPASPGSGEGLTELLSRHRGALVFLVTPAAEPVPEGPWDLVIHRPVTIGEIVARVRERVPLESGAAADS